jgi:hypothetical protein
MSKQKGSLARVEQAMRTIPLDKFLSGPQPKILRRAPEMFTIRLTGKEIYLLTQHLRHWGVEEGDFDKIQLCVFLHDRITEQARAQGFGLPGSPTIDEKARGTY